MRRSGDFTAVVRDGARTRRGSVVVHLHRTLTADGAPLVGLIVGKPVGASVVRHQVSRRLRAQMTSRIATLPNTAGVVIRALPESADATSVRLGTDLDSALRHLLPERSR